MKNGALLVVATLAVAAAVGGVYWISHRQTALRPLSPTTIPKTTTAQTTKNDIAKGALALGSQLISAWSSKS